MAEQAEQTQTESQAIHSPSDWAAKLQESSKPAPEEEEQSLAPQEEESEDEVEAELDDPTSQEDQDEDEETELEADAEESEETEPSEDESEQSSIVADGTYIVDGEEIDGQTLINGIAATKNFAQEKHRLRVESQELLDTEVAQLHTQRDEYAAGLNFMLGVNQQAQQQYSNVNWMQLQAEDPAKYQQMKEGQGRLLANQQQLQGQFDQFLTQVKDSQTEASRKSAESSISILNDTFGGTEGWTKRYPELGKVAEGFGWRNEEFITLTDHRFMMLLDEVGKARTKIAEIESNTKKKTANPVKDKKRRNSARVNTSQSRKMGDARDKLSATGKPKDGAAMWLQAQAGSKDR